MKTYPNFTLGLAAGLIMYVQHEGETYVATLFPGPEITDELVKVLRKRLDETTLDIITVMLVRNCKLTPADVEVNGFFHSTVRCDLQNAPSVFLGL